MHVLPLPSHVQDLVLLYLAVSDADDLLDEHERAATVAMLQAAAPGLDDDVANAVVETAHQATRSGLAEDPAVLARSLRGRLSADRRRRVLSDLGRLAQADGHVSLAEASVIATVRSAWAEAGSAGPRE